MRAIVVEVVARLDALAAMQDDARVPRYARQVSALEALQIYAPMGHALGMGHVSTELEDRCFQVRRSEACDGMNAPSCCCSVSRGTY